jgi:hypothetical protein
MNEVLNVEHRSNDVKTQSGPIRKLRESDRAAPSEACAALQRLVNRLVAAEAAPVLHVGTA